MRNFLSYEEFLNEAKADVDARWALILDYWPTNIENHKGDYFDTPLLDIEETTSGHYKGAKGLELTLKDSKGELYYFLVNANGKVVATHADTSASYEIKVPELQKMTASTPSQNYSSIMFAITLDIQEFIVGRRNKWKKV